MKRFAIILGIMLMASFTFADNGSGSSKSFLVRIAQVKQGNIEEYIYTYGKIQGLQEAVVIPPMPGRVVNILKHEGEKVTKDEIIALLDREIPGVKTEYLQITSPIDGVITLINGKEGQFALQTQPFAYISSEEQVVECALSSDDLSRVQVGTKAYVVVEGKEVSGKVVNKSLGVDPIYATGRVRIQLSRGSLPYGSVVKTKIVVRSKNNVLIVPQSAIVEREGKNVVYTLSGNKVREVEVKIGISSEGYVEVTGNLKPNDSVVILGAEGLYDGAPVEVGGSSK